MEEDYTRRLELYLWHLGKIFFKDYSHLSDGPVSHPLHPSSIFSM